MAVWQRCSVSMSPTTQQVTENNGGTKFGFLSIYRDVSGTHGLNAEILRQKYQSSDINTRANSDWKTSKVLQFLGGVLVNS